MLPDFNPDTWGELEAVYLGGSDAELGGLVARVEEAGGMSNPEVRRALTRWVRDNYLNEGTNAGRDPVDAEAFIAWVESETS